VVRVDHAVAHLEVNLGQRRDVLEFSEVNELCLIFEMLFDYFSDGVLLFSSYGGAARPSGVQTQACR
jgi:hypothetical protein